MAKAANVDVKKIHFFFGYVFPGDSRAEVQYEEETIGIVEVTINKDFELVVKYNPIKYL